MVKKSKEDFFFFQIGFDRSKKMEHLDRPERAKWMHSETIRSCVETREANAKTEKGEEEKAKRGE